MHARGHPDTGYRANDKRYTARPRRRDRRSDFGIRRPSRPGLSISIEIDRSVPTAGFRTLHANPAFLGANLIVELIEEAEAEQPVNVVAGRELEHMDAVVRHDESECGTLPIAERIVMTRSPSRTL